MIRRTEKRNEPISPILPLKDSKAYFIPTSGLITVSAAQGALFSAAGKIQLKLQCVYIRVAARMTEYCYN